MTDTTREHMLESIIVDLCEAELTWYEIQERTGLSEERAREIEEVIDGLIFPTGESIKWYCDVERISRLNICGEWHKLAKWFEDGLSPSEAIDKYLERS
jgi:hypothetical protein